MLLQVNFTAQVVNRANSVKPYRSQWTDQEYTTDGVTIGRSNHLNREKWLLEQLI